MGLSLQAPTPDRYKAVTRCRANGSNNLLTVLSLGNQALTGIFPRDVKQPITVGPLDLVWCQDSGLLQLAHSYDPGEMYGSDYGYRSGLNQSMVRHLSNKVGLLEKAYRPVAGDTVLDIGSNDSTLLRAYQTAGLRRIGIDPTGAKFRQYYPDDVTLVPDFFSRQAFERAGGGKARIVTSIAMFYDLESPTEFARQVAGILADDGIWHLEQSYLPSMLRLCSYDTICHEHIEYYSLGSITKILAAAGLKVIDVQMNGTNGGSFAVTAALQASPLPANEAVISWLLGQEERMGLDTPRPYRDFETRVFQHRLDLQKLLGGLKASGKRILGYGASTKGNVMLQFCGLGPDTIDAIAEVNPDKFGAYNPGHAHPDHLRGGSPGDAARLLPGASMALQGRHPAARAAVPGRGRQDDLPIP